MRPFGSWTGKDPLSTSPCPRQKRGCRSYFGGVSAGSCDGTGPAPTLAGAAAPPPIAGPVGVPLSVVVPSAPPVSVLPVALEPDVGGAGCCPAPTAGPLGVPLSVVVASAPPVRVLPVSLVAGPAVCAQAPLLTSPAASKAAATARLNEMSTTTSKKNQGSCAAPLLTTCKPKPDNSMPDATLVRLRYGAEVLWRNGLTPDSKQGGIDFIQTLCVAQRLVCVAACNE